MRVLTRRAGGEPGPFRRMVGDLLTGDGLSSAVDGVDLVVHCATTLGKRDIPATRRLVEAARRTGENPHLLYVSIVGIDRIGLPYYRSKLACEGVIAESGLPWTIQRATQFHDLLATVFAWQRWSPVTVTARGIRFQPIDTRDVAARLATLASADPSGHAPDIGGPQTLDMRDMARAYNVASRRRRRVVSVRVPGAVARQFAAGYNLAPKNASGTITFGRFLAAGGAR